MKYAIIQVDDVLHLIPSVSLNPMQMVISGLGEDLWAPALVFICCPSLAMAAILLVHNGWMALCINWFTTVVLRSDLNELLKVGEFGDLLLS